MQNQMVKLMNILTLADIPYEVTECWGTPQVWYPSRKEAVCDVICHRGSYGYKEGLLEMMGLLTEEEGEEDDVVGWLTAWDVAQRIYAHYMSTTKEEKEEE